MKILRCPPIPGGRDHELIWGSLLLMAALLAAAWLLSGIPTPLCPLHALSGIPCPTCGMTRAASALLHGDFIAALLWNPLMTLVLTGAALYIPYAVIVATGKLMRLRWTQPTLSEVRWIRIAIILLIAANWAYLLWKGI